MYNYADLGFWDAIINYCPILSTISTLWPFHNRTRASHRTLKDLATMPRCRVLNLFRARNICSVQTVSWIYWQARAAFVRAKSRPSCWCLAEGCFLPLYASPRPMMQPNIRRTHPPLSSLAFQSSHKWKLTSNLAKQTLLTSRISFGTSHTKPNAGCLRSTLAWIRNPQSAIRSMNWSHIYPCQYHLMTKASRNRSPGFCSFMSETHTRGR